MESGPQNPEFRTNPENFHPCSCCEKSRVYNPSRGAKLLRNTGSLDKHRKEGIGYTNGPHHDKTRLSGFQLSVTQTSLLSYRDKLEN